MLRVVKGYFRIGGGQGFCRRDGIEFDFLYFGNLYQWMRKGKISLKVVVFQVRNDCGLDQGSGSEDGKN